MRESTKAAVRMFIKRLNKLGLENSMEHFNKWEISGNNRDGNIARLFINKYLKMKGLKLTIY